MSAIHRFTRYFHHNESGATFLFVAGAVGTLAIAIGASVEMSRYAAAKSAFRHAVDQATVAAASAGQRQDKSATSYGSRFLQTSLDEKGIKVKSFSVQVGTNKNSWVGTANGSIDLPFTKTLGIKNLPLQHSATVAWDNSAKSEIVAMVDVSGTMCANFRRTVKRDGSVTIAFVPDRTCKKMDMMREALQNIVDIGVGISETAPEPIFKVGVVPFTHKVRLPNPSAVPDFLIKAERDSQAAGGDGTADYFTNLADANPTGAPPLPQVLPLREIRNAGDKTQFKNDVKRLFSANDAEFNRPFMKRSALGAHISALMLDPRHHAMFGGTQPSAFGTPKTEKIVIMMTDSANLGCCYTNWPANNFTNNYIYSYNPDHLHLVGDRNRAGICKQMHDAGITVYTVLLDVDENDMDERGEEIITAFETCATDKSKAFRVPLKGGEDALKHAYNTIGTALLNLRVVK